MKILHICSDRNFIDESRIVFDKYFPESNIFIVHSLSYDLKVIKNSEGMMIKNLEDFSVIREVENLIKEHEISNVVLHGLNIHWVDLLQYLKKNIEVKFYWLYWGYELYETIGYEKGYKLIDASFNPFNKIYYLTVNPFSKFLRKMTGRYRPSKFIAMFSLIDYFCFWNKLDYSLLQKYYPSTIKYKFFAYGANEKGKEMSGLWDFQTSGSKVIMINHQASLFGNHSTVFNKIKKIDVLNEYQKIVPLSYGSNHIKKEVLRKGTSLFKDKFCPILTLLPKNEYFSMLKDVDVAIFGQLRQEASGNISQLLKNGVKIFLRNGNNLLEFYKSKGYILYSFEDDLKSIDDLKPLSMEEKMHNRETARKNMIYYDDFMPFLFDDK